MEKSEITKMDAIHCKTEAEFNRIMELFNMDEEFMDWDFFEEDTVLYPFTGQYGDLNGYCKEKKFNVISSAEITL